MIGSRNVSVIVIDAYEHDGNYSSMNEVLSEYKGFMKTWFSL